MKSIQRFLALLLVAALLIPAGAPAEVIPEEGIVPSEEEMPKSEWLTAEQEEEYQALGMWMKESEGTVTLFDLEDNQLELEEDMRFSSGTVLETEEESLAVVDMDRERLAIMDEISRAGFDKADSGSRISITLHSGAMYFRVGRPLEEEESFDVVMDDIRLAIRGTCGMVQQSEDGMSIILASGHAVITHVPEDNGEPEDEPDEETPGEPGEEPEEIMIEAGEIVSVSKEETDDGIRFEKKKLAEDEVPAFLKEALRRDPEQLEKVYMETGWQLEDSEKTQGKDTIIKKLDQLDETVRSYYQAMINEKDRFDYQDYGEQTAKYQYALVYMDEKDTIPALLLAECSWDSVRYIKVFQYDPDKPGLWENLDPLNEYRNMLYLREGGKGLLIWYADGAYDSGIMEIRLEQYNLKYNKLWYGQNGTWPEEIPKEDIAWIDI